MGKSTISMAMFNSYVSLPEGNPIISRGFLEMGDPQWFSGHPFFEWMMSFSTATQRQNPWSSESSKGVTHHHPLIDDFAGWCFLFPSYPLVIKHGLLENPSFIYY